MNINVVPLSKIITNKIIIENMRIGAQMINDFLPIKAQKELSLSDLRKNIENDFVSMKLEFILIPKAARFFD